MDLEKLRKKRLERMDLPKSPSTISDYAFVRRQFLIFERALKRFKSDIGLWIQYIQVAKREGARALVGRVTARALQLHPSNPSFYILAASHELDNHSPSAARSLLQRGIRINPDSIDLWKEYVKMELGFIEGLRRRWEILGITAFPETSAQMGKPSEEDQEAVDPSSFLSLGEEEDIVMRPSPENVDKPTDMAEDADGVDGAEGRRQILEGAIVNPSLAVLLKLKWTLTFCCSRSSSAKGGLVRSPRTAISEYPSPPSLLDALLTLPRDPRSMELRAQRYLKQRGQPKHGVELVEGLRQANEEMLGVIGDEVEETLSSSYARFVEHWYSKVDDDHLRNYLISSLKRLIQHEKASPSLLAAHIKLLQQTPSFPPAKVLRVAEKYTNKVPQSSRVWLARLAVEAKARGDAAALDVWREARTRVGSNQEDVMEVWLWGVEHSTHEVRQHGPIRPYVYNLTWTPICLQEVLKESLRTSSLQSVHEVLLLNYVTVLEEACRTPESGLTSDQGNTWTKWLDAVRHMGSGYLPTGRVWQATFAVVAQGVKSNRREGTCAGGSVWTLAPEGRCWGDDGMGQLALAHGKGIEASRIIVEGGRGLNGIDSAELEKRWQEALGSR
ncbi:U3 snoRNP protein [Coprinopsis sp. MPI-PUGE-AT-0042]|nr:U3 snoRNP protein [Coprinopsis sp. MPI-PUGE-AT-0042]